MRRHAPEHRETSHERTPARYCRQTAGKLNRVQALEAVFIGTVETKDGRISTQEAVRQLTVEKAIQVRLQNEFTRGERIPLDDVAEITNRCFMEIAGIVKASGLPIKSVNEILYQLRSAGERLVTPPQNAERLNKEYAI